MLDSSYMAIMELLSWHFSFLIKKQVIDIIIFINIKIYAVCLRKWECIDQWNWLQNNNTMSLLNRRHKKPYICTLHTTRIIVSNLHATHRTARKNKPFSLGTTTKTWNFSGKVPLVCTLSMSALFQYHITYITYWFLHFIWTYHITPKDWDLCICNFVYFNGQKITTLWSKM